MCRIAGIIDKRSKQIGDDIICMRDAMKHGGPDSAGLYTDDTASLALGHRRLSIIDLSENGHQPMLNEEATITLIFNGEIYNYLELRQELCRQGFHFFSHCDTEVILKGYECWGVNCFNRLEGMFAIAIYDKRKGKLILARDYAGIKPLYYYADGACIYFASEIRSFKALKNRWEENPDWKIYFLTYGFLPHSVTTLKGVKPLEKGSFIVFDTNTLQSEQTFYYTEHYEERITNVDEAKELVRHGLEKAVNRHLIADAPIGLFLSGGVDSSLLTLVASQFKSELHTLSIIFNEENYSEKYYQDIIVKKAHTNHQAFTLDKKQFTAAIPDILEAMDQPSADGINSYFISKYAKEAGLKAVLSGLGADELFGGYPSFKRAGLVKNLRRLRPLLSGWLHLIPDSKYQKIRFLDTDQYIGNFLFSRGYFTPLQTAKLFDMDVSEINEMIYNAFESNAYSQLSDGNKVSFMESDLYMQNQLLRDTDFMSMWHSVEVRVPFLDYGLVQLAHSIGSKLKYGNKQGKYLLIDSFKDRLPEEIWNRKKKGFQLPFDTWMQQSLDQLIHSKKDKEVHSKFKEGKMVWSRYWAYLLTQTFPV